MVLVDWKKLALAGMTSDTVIQRDIEREVIYRKADLLAVGTKLLPMRNFSVLDVKFEFPSEFEGEYPVPEGAMAKLEKIIWTPFDMSLEKCQVHYLITDEAKARQLDDYQRKTGIKRAAEAMAKKMDYHIIDTVVAGAYATNTVTVAAGDEWNSGGAGVDIDGNIADAIGNILDNSNISLEDLSNVNMVVPSTVWKEFKKLKLIGNVQQKLMDYFKSTHGLGIYPSRYWDTVGLEDDAYITVHSDDTGLVGSFNPPANLGIPLTEQRRKFGTAEEFLFTRWFKAKIQPYSDSETTSRLIAKIANVC